MYIFDLLWRLVKNKWSVNCYYLCSFLVKEKWVLYHSASFLNCSHRARQFLETLCSQWYGSLAFWSHIYDQWLNRAIYLHGLIAEFDWWGEILIVKKDVYNENDAGWNTFLASKRISTHSHHRKLSGNYCGQIGTCQLFCLVGRKVYSLPWQTPSVWWLPSYCKGATIYDLQKQPHHLSFIGIIPSYFRVACNEL